MLRKNILSGLTIILLGFMPIAVAAPAYAAGPTSTTHANFFQGLITFLEQKFGLDHAQVTAAVTDYKNQQKQNMQTNMQSREKTRLDRLVSSEKITSAQETAIIAELASLNVTPTRSETPAQRMQQMQQMQASFKTWAAAQNPPIDPTLIMPMGGRGGRGGFGKWGQRMSPTPTP